MSPRTDPPATPLAAALRAALERDSRLRGWQIFSARRLGFQTYLVKTELECERRTADETLEVSVFVANGELVGRSTISLVPGDEGILGRKIDEAVYMAGLGGDAPWKLPGAGSMPKVEVYDPALADARSRATSREIVEAWRATVAGQRGVRPSSMELFCAENWVTLENSAGLVAHASATRVSMLTLVLADGDHVSERYSWEERRRAADLDVHAIVARAAEEARDLTRAVEPPSGQYPVVIDAEEIRALLSPIEINSSAAGLYRKSSRFETGKPLPIEVNGGEPVTVISDATMPFGLGSYVFDESGVAGRRVEIVKDNVFVRPWGTKQYADYLQIESTGNFANLELPAGRTPLAELTAGDGPVLYVRSFSDLSPDQSRGNFASEIRVGYLYEKGVRKPVKGGTVSGNVFTALGTARASKETVFLGRYLGPTAIRLEGLTVAGA
jgi:predicted Zn-dependent protease